MMKGPHARTSPRHVLAHHHLCARCVARCCARSPGGASGSRVAPGSPGPLPGQLRSPGPSRSPPGLTAHLVGSATDASAIAAANPHMSRDEAEMLATYASALDK